MRAQWMSRKGQSTLEYAILIAVVVAAAIGMQVYVKRGFQGRLKQSADSIGDQYAPGKTTSNYKRTLDATRTEDVFQEGQTSSTKIDEIAIQTEVGGAHETVQETFSGATLFKP